MFNINTMRFSIESQQKGEEILRRIKPSFVCSVLSKIAEENNCKLIKVETDCFIFSISYSIKIKGKRKDFEKFIDAFFRNDKINEFFIYNIHY